MLLEQISAQTSLSTRYLSNLALSANHRYKVYSIPKRTGGIRWIAHPSRKLKFLQRWLVRNLIAGLPVHNAATAYRESVSVKDNATAHADNNFLLKLDFKDFFPSLTAADVAAHLTRNAHLLPYQLDDFDKLFVAATVTRGRTMPIGAPSSPLLSNQIMYEFDSRVAMVCEPIGVTFTRYADDIFLSTSEPNILAGVHSQIQLILDQLTFPRLQLNVSKTVYTSRRRRRLVTGIILTSDGRLSLGREKKRYVRGMLYRLRTEQLSIDDAQYLAGYLAYANSIEPTFVASLRAKYGDHLVALATGSAG